MDFEAAADLSGAFLTLRGVGRAWLMRVSVVDLAFAGLAAGDFVEIVPTSLDVVVYRGSCPALLAGF